MYADCRGLDVTAASSDAVAAFDATVDAYLGIKPSAGPNLKATFAADPDMPMAHVMKAYFFMLMATGPLRDRAQKAAADADQRAESATPREQLHIQAAQHWSHGRKHRAIGAWEAILVQHPHDILAMRLAHHGYFYEGDGQNLRDTVTRRLFAWGPNTPGYGFVKGMQAFGYEETHAYDAAIRAGEEALEVNPSDPWAIHAVAHVHEMTRQPQAGIEWIDRHQSGWLSANNFRYHVWWHKMLMLLEQGHTDAVLELYDGTLWDSESDEYLDLVNDAAILLRLELHGIDVGDRWEPLAAKCRGHSNDHVLAFVDAHYAVALAAAKNDGASALLDSMRTYAESGGDENAVITDRVGLPLAEAIIAHRAGEYGKAVELLLPIRYDLFRIGGSHAQRDLFAMVLIDAALKSNRLNVAKMLISERMGRAPTGLWTDAKAADAGLMDA